VRRSWLVVLVAVAAAVGAVLLRPVAAEWRAAGESPAPPGDSTASPAPLAPGGSRGARSDTVPERTAGERDRAAGVRRERAVGVLHEWDRRRAAAYAEGDATALRRLYVPGSTAGRADVRLLKGYVARGYVVTGMRMQLMAVRVVATSADRLRLRVTDRLSEAVAVTDTDRVRLPHDEASDRVIVLCRDAGGWRVAAVRDVRPPPVPVN
jgi:hypothetical protein